MSMVGRVVSDRGHPARGRRASAKQWLSHLPHRGAAPGMTALIYHRIGGESRDERDIATAAFVAQLDLLTDHQVVAIDDALDGLGRGDSSPRVVLTFDDGFRDLYDNGFPLLRERGLPFTIYLTTSYVGGVMHWDGSTAHDTDAPAVDWHQLEEMQASGLLTVGNHTHTHARPEELTVDQLDRCTELITQRLGVVPAHFAYTWGVPVPAMETSLRERFRSAATGQLGRNLPATDLMRLNRVPVRGSDPLDFFAAKLGGHLLSERVYAGLVTAAKRVGARG
jgi:peptidoglycan/xylan/chitin deacetylase (PgdA/CDA1 family)